VFVQRTLPFRATSVSPSYRALLDNRGPAKKAGKAQTRDLAPILQMCGGCAGTGSALMKAARRFLRHFSFSFRPTPSRLKRHLCKFETLAHETVATAIVFFESLKAL
jgi:hypothetical protein